MTISIPYVDPKMKAPLSKDDTAYYSESGSIYPIANHIPRFVDSTQNYTQSFGLQWKKFSKTQMDDTDQKQSETRFFATTNWRPEELAGNIDSLITIFDFLVKARLGAITRFLPIVDLRTIPSTLDKQKRREWAI